MRRELQIQEEKLLADLSAAASFKIKLRDIYIKRRKLRSRKRR